MNLGSNCLAGAEPIMSKGDTTTLQDFRMVAGLGMQVVVLAMAAVIVEMEGVAMVEVAIVDSHVQIKFQVKAGFIMSKVLISYSQADSEIADEIVRTLVKQKVEIVRDVRDVSWGESV